MMQNHAREHKTSKLLCLFTARTIHRKFIQLVASSPAKMDWFCSTIKFLSHLFYLNWESLHSVIVNGEGRNRAKILASRTVSDNILFSGGFRFKKSQNQAILTLMVLPVIACLIYPGIITVFQWKRFPLLIKTKLLNHIFKTGEEQ